MAERICDELAKSKAPLEWEEFINRKREFMKFFKQTNFYIRGQKLKLFIKFRASEMLANFHSAKLFLDIVESEGATMYPKDLENHVKNAVLHTNNLYARWRRHDPDALREKIKLIHATADGVRARNRVQPKDPKVRAAPAPCVNLANPGPGSGA
jgi:hypothetical protein